MAADNLPLVPLEGWARLELMGHRVRYGYVREVEMLGAKLLRIDILGEDKDSPGAVEFYGATAIYCLGLIGEEAARKACEPYRPRLTGPEVHSMAQQAAHDADFDDFDADEVPY